MGKKINHKFSLACPNVLVHLPDILDIGRNFIILERPSGKLKRTE